MPGKAAVFAALLLAGAAVPGVPSTLKTSLILRVDPEARLDPARIALNFQVSADGSSDVISQTTEVGAWVRALPGRRIRVTARLGALNGPDGPVL